MAKIKTSKKEQVIELNDIVSISLDKKQFIKDALKAKKFEGMEMTDEIKNKVEETVDGLIGDLKTMKGIVVSTDDEWTIVSFDDHKDWMCNFVFGDNEFCCNTKYINFIEKPDMMELILKKFKNQLEKKNKEEYLNTIKVVESSKRDLTNYRETILGLIDRIKIETEKGDRLKDSGKIKMEFGKNKMIEKTYADNDYLYILTKELPYLNQRGEELFTRDRFVIRINPAYSNGYEDILISNVSSYFKDVSNAGGGYGHCCINAYRPCLGGTMMSALKNCRNNLPAYIQAIISYIEKPDYDRPYINESSYKDDFVKFSKEFNEDDLSKAFDSSFLRSLE